MRGALVPIREELGDCRRCKLAGGRTTLVFGVGHAEADIVFVGEGPGRNEDEQAEPFVGAAGQLLDRVITNVLRSSREQVYICNVVKCRPPGNRDPEPDEIEACSPFLERQLDALKPVVVIALGRFAAQTLLQTRTPIGRLRGTAHPFRGVRLVPTWHPAYLLRAEGDRLKQARRQLMDDMMLVRSVYAEAKGEELPPPLSGRQARGR